MWENACTKGQIVKMHGGCWYRGRSHLARSWVLEAYQRELAASALLSCPLSPLPPFLFWFATSLLDFPRDAPVLLARDLNRLMLSL